MTSSAAADCPQHFFHTFQQADSLEIVYSVWQGMAGGELAAVPVFRPCTTFATACRRSRLSRVHFPLMTFRNRLPEHVAAVLSAGAGVRGDRISGVVRNVG